MGEIVNIPDTYTIPPDRPYSFNPLFDTRCDYRTRSALVVPLQDPNAHVFGVLELINALDPAGCVVPFDMEYETLVRALASQAAVAIRNARFQDLSFKDALTDVYNRRYFMLRIDEEWKRHSRFAEPVSLVLLDLDHFKDVNDRFGHRAGDEALKEVARLLVKHSRNFTIVTRYGGDEFAVLLVNTPKAGAVTYANRIRDVIAQHAFVHGSVTVSLGVASLPEDAANSDDLVAGADKAMYEAKRLGRNRVAVL
jgi:diguanylate cyclase (GGDEF)-like protein